MRRSGLDSRLARLEDRQDQEIKRVLVQKIAEDEGISASELLAEMECMTATCHAQGITSGPAIIRYWGAELGITLEDREQQMERYRELMT